MIINVRGGNASGKSWVMRQALARFPAGPPVMWTDGKKIEGYDLAAPAPTFLIGKYDEANTGGCDTFKDMDQVIEIVKRQHSAGKHVLFEGIRVHGAHQRWVDLGCSNFAPRTVYRFVILNTSIEQSQTNMLARRAAVNDPRPLSPATLDSIQDHYGRGLRQVRHFGDRGLWVKRMSAEDAVARIVEWVSAP